MSVRRARKRILFYLLLAISLQSLFLDFQRADNWKMDLATYNATVDGPKLNGLTEFGKVWPYIYFQPDCITESVVGMFEYFTSHSEHFQRRK